MQIAKIKDRVNADPIFTARWKAWISALRSGEYKQGQGKLKMADKFCCLGVVTDLAVKEGKGKWRGNRFYPNTGPFSNYGSGLLPCNIACLLGWSEAEVRQDWVAIAVDQDVLLLHIAVDDAAQALDRLNDSGYSFLQIADLIEKELGWKS